MTTSFQMSMDITHSIREALIHFVPNACHLMIGTVVTNVGIGQVALHLTMAKRREAIGHVLEVLFPIMLNEARKLVMIITFQGNMKSEWRREPQFLNANVV